MSTMQLTSAFQHALGVLVTNHGVAQSLAMGELRPRELCEELTDSDVRALDCLFETQRDRVLATAELLTGRRRARIVRSLPATLHVLGKRFAGIWRSYLQARITLGAPQAPQEAAAFARWLLPRVAGELPLSQILLFELRVSEVAATAPVRDGGGTLTVADLLRDAQRVRFSRSARIERFSLPVDMLLEEFRSSREIAISSAADPCQLLIHRARPHGDLRVTRVVDSLARVLRLLEEDTVVNRLLEAMPAPRRQPTLERLAELANAGVIELIARESYEGRQ